MRGALAGAALALAATPCRARAQRTWGLEVGHSYSSIRALHQPATLTVIVADSIATAIDGGLLFGGPLGAAGSLEFGVRASAGSARLPASRTYGAIARGYIVPGAWVVALSVEYEADGGFDVQKSVAGIEASPVGDMRWCLGVRCRRSHVLWRPWVGLGAGNTLRGTRGLLEPEGSSFARAYLRSELSWVPSPRVELNAEATGWLLSGRRNGRSAVSAALAVELGQGFSLAAKGQLGRRPPHFAYQRSLSVGLGYVRRR